MAEGYISSLFRPAQNWADFFKLGGWRNKPNRYYGKLNTEAYENVLIKLHTWFAVNTNAIWRPWKKHRISFVPFQLWVIRSENTWWYNIHFAAGVEGAGESGWLTNFWKNSHTSENREIKLPIFSNLFWLWPNGDECWLLNHGTKV